ncbi:hypothetical protein HO173_003576 [Letharia columbiana]|uniref:Cytochrome P450 n=1 Tax=Letharia columbiana TaxID=112416 RepID=A0A8H6L797_9LECA|nr:uncharacterized protein HO173_003576 [Letharia columbiana]KAF6238296.1 hypothetical protein HO173_003576 [Letharia columbiana]
MVTTADVADHARMRKVMNRAFAPWALRAQEPTVEASVSLLVERLGEQVAPSQHDDPVVETNTVDWYDYVAFDIVGDLGFGGSFQCLQSVSPHPWLALIFGSLKGMPLAAAARY